MAARSLLLKLQDRGLITLPAKRRTTVNRMKVRPAVAVFDLTPIESSLKDLGGLEVREVSPDKPARKRLASALAQHHYLGHGGTVGENLQYTVSDARGRLLAGLLLGSAAWKCQDRDQWIGWTGAQREKHLHLTANNTRFLILPWVRVPQLAALDIGPGLARTFP
jgi:hypothetical protein